MSSKEKVEFVHGDVFDDVEAALMSAMSVLDETNARITDLLDSEPAVEGSGEMPSPEDDSGKQETSDSTGEVEA